MFIPVHSGASSTTGARSKGKKLDPPPQRGKESNLTADVTKITTFPFVDLLHYIFALPLFPPSRLLTDVFFVALSYAGAGLKP